MAEDKRVLGFCFYDWGKSAFETSVTTAIFPAWFAYLFAEANGISMKMIGSEWTADAVFSGAVMIAALVVAICSPSFGVIADKRMIKLWWLRVLTYLGAGATILLALSPFMGISMGWIWALLMFIIANIGLNGAGVFYNALLPHMGKDDEMDSISNKAFAYGYLGGGLLLVVHLAMVMLIVDDGGSTLSWVIPFAMASSGVWWLGFAMLTFKWIPEPHIENEMEAMGIKDSAIMATNQVVSTLKEAKSFKTLFMYMFAYFLFIDGINSVTALAGAFGIVVLGLTTTGLIITIVLIQFVAAPAALGFTKLAEKWGTKKALQFSLICWCFVIAGALSFAPLELVEHEEFGIQYDWDEELDSYTMNTSESIAPLAAMSSDEEQKWALENQEILPVESNPKTDNSVMWVTKSLTVDLDSAKIAALKDSMKDSRFSLSVNGGTLADESIVGTAHPTSLGDGLLDVIPQTARDKVWQPLGIGVMVQFMLLGVMAGALLGGSQGLSRSLFGQMVPETRSAEFFGFFGFFGKVAALLGPLLYMVMTVAFDSRVGIFSISLLIIGGAIMLRKIDVEDGIAVANAEDARNRALETE